MQRRVRKDRLQKRSEEGVTADQKLNGANVGACKRYPKTNADRGCTSILTEVAKKDKIKGSGHKRKQAAKSGVYTIEKERKRSGADQKEMKRVEATQKHMER